MFRKSGNSKMSTENFGVGSLIKAGPGEVFMLVSLGGQSVAILDMRTFSTIGKLTVVEDIHHLAEDELRECINNAGMGNAFSDYEFYASGLKYKARDLC